MLPRRRNPAPLGAGGCQFASETCDVLPPAWYINCAIREAIHRFGRLTPARKTGWMERLILQAHLQVLLEIRPPLAFDRKNLDEWVDALGLGGARDGSSFCRTIPEMTKILGNRILVLLGVGEMERGRHDRDGVLNFYLRGEAVDLKALAVCDGWERYNNPVIPKLECSEQTGILRHLVSPNRSIIPVACLAEKAMVIKYCGGIMDYEAWDTATDPWREVIAFQEAAIPTL
jgi:hypothetical protein